MPRFPNPTGPYGVGTLTYHWVDATRPELFTRNPADRRELMVQLWYPARRDAAGRRAPYVEDGSALVPLARLLQLPDFAFTHLQQVTTNAVRAAPIADGEPNFPVLIFSHGRGGFRQHNTQQVEELASRGYVVAAIDHPYVAAGVRFPDGRQVSFDKRLLPPWPQRTPRGIDAAWSKRVVPYLARDASFTLDQLGALNGSDPNGILTGRLDLGRSGIFGASLGGMVAAEACQLDPRFRACLILDVYMPPDVVESGLEQPTMWISRDAETMRQEGWPQEEIQVHQSSMRSVFERLPGDGYLVLVPGMFHADFSDGSLLSPLTSELGITGPIDPDRARHILNAYELAFFDRHLRAMPAQLLDGPPRAYPEVRFETRRR